MREPLNGGCEGGDELGVPPGVVDLGPNSIETLWHEFWLEKLLEFRLEIPYTGKMFKKWVV